MEEDSNPFRDAAIELSKKLRSEVAEDKTGGPAFPSSSTSMPNTHPSFRTKITDGGMTLRDYFAAKALQALIAGPIEYSDPELAEGAYQIADAMIEERSK